MDREEIKFLLQAAQKGDRKAYQSFLSKIYPVVEKVVQRRVFELSDVDDVISEALLGIHKSLQTFDGSREVLPWVRSITHYKVIDYIRKTSGKRDNEVFFPEGDVTIYGINSNSPIEAFELLKEVPPALRKPLVLAKLEGRSTREVSEMLGLSEANVRARISRAMKVIKKILEDESKY